MAIEFQVTFDSADPAAHAAFWAEALRYVPQPPAGGVPVDGSNDYAALVDPQGAGPRLLFQKVVMQDPEGNEFCLD